MLIDGLIKTPKIVTAKLLSQDLFTLAKESFFGFVRFGRFSFFGSKA